MYELIKVAEHTYYVDCPSKIGIYNYSENDVCLIDSGNDKDAAKKVLRHIEQNNWNLKFIINTHSHADHIGGNAYLAEKTGCKLYAPGIDACFSRFTILEPSYLYGGFPPKALCNKFLVAKESNVMDLSLCDLPKGMEVTDISGHSFNMVAVKTGDDVWFIADALASKTTLDKYHVSFVYDVEKYIDSINKLSQLCGNLFVPSHADVCENIGNLAEINISKCKELCELIVNICKKGCSFDEILKQIFDHYNMTLDINQYALSGSTVRSYLTYLESQNRLLHAANNNKVEWNAVNNEL